MKCPPLVQYPGPMLATTYAPSFRAALAVAMDFVCTLADSFFQVWGKLHIVYCAVKNLCVLVTEYAVGNKIA